MSQCIASLPRVMQSCDNSFIGFVGAGFVEMSATAMGPPLSYFVCSCWLRYLHEGCGFVPPVLTPLDFSFSWPAVSPVSRKRYFRRRQLDPASLEEVTLAPALGSLLSLNLVV